MTALRDSEPFRVRDFDGFDRVVRVKARRFGLVVNLPDNDDRSGVLVGRKGPLRQHFDGGEIALHLLKPDTPDG